jgi:hypothetical protein
MCSRSEVKATTCSRAKVKMAACPRTGVKAAACPEAWVEAVACFGARVMAVVCSGAGPRGRWCARGWQTVMSEVIRAQRRRQMGERSVFENFGKCWERGREA